MRNNDMKNAWVNFINLLDAHQLDALDDALTKACLKAQDEDKEEIASLFDNMADLVEDQIDYLKVERDNVEEMEEAEANRYC